MIISFQMYTLLQLSKLQKAIEGFSDVIVMQIYFPESSQYMVYAYLCMQVYCMFVYASVMHVKFVYASVN